MGRSAAAVKALDTTAFHREDGQKRRVLYAEDQASARIVTTALLERMGFEVVAVEDGELALEQAKQSTYDVILLDIEMPVMDGVTAARCIREEATLCRETPILALSAFLADSTEHSIWRDAFDSALPKPANSNELHKAMQKVLKARHVTAPAVVAPAHWSDFGRDLPLGTVNMLVKVALQEMNHLVLAFASCAEAGDAAGIKQCRYGLKSIAASFEAHEITDMLQAMAELPGKADVVRLLDAVAIWHQRQCTRR